MSEQFENVDKLILEAVRQNKLYITLPVNNYPIEQLKSRYGQDAVIFSEKFNKIIINLLKVQNEEVKLIIFKQFTQIQETPSNDIKVLPVDYKEYIVNKVEEYVEVRNEYQTLKTFFELDNENNNILITGYKGTGKDLMIANLACELNIPLITVDCHEQMKRIDFIGRFIWTGSETPYLLGFLPTAIEVANQAYEAGLEGVILNLSELGSLPPRSQKLLNSMLDWRKSVFIPEIGRTYRLLNDAKLMITATQNPTFYAASYEINEDLKSRFAEIYVEYPPKTKETRVIISKVPEMTNHPDILDKLMTLVLETRKAFEGHQLSYPLSPRDAIKFCKVFITTNNIELALQTTVINRFDPREQKEELDLVKARIFDIFGIKF